MREYIEYDITEEEMDMLREAGNIASGNAMTSLSKLVNSTLNMNVVKVRIEKIQELPEALGNAEDVIAGMAINVYGDINAMMLLAFETQSAIGTVNRMLDKTLGSLEEFDEIDHSVLCETGNILAGSYLSTLNILTGLRLDISIPEIAIDMAGAILSYPAIELARNDNTMLFIETVFRDSSSLLNGTYILILDRSAYRSVIRSLGAYHL